MFTPEWLSSDVTDLTKNVGGKLGKSEKLVEGSKQVNKVVEGAGAVVDGTFDFLSWSKSNWQLVVVGAVALVVLLRK